MEDWQLQKILDRKSEKLEGIIPLRNERVKVYKVYSTILYRTGGSVLDSFITDSLDGCFNGIRDQQNIPNAPVIVMGTWSVFEGNDDRPIFTFFMVNHNAH